MEYFSHKYTYTALYLLGENEEHKSALNPKQAPNLDASKRRVGPFVWEN